jgi:TPR repeat protein
MARSEPAVAEPLAASPVAIKPHEEALTSGSSQELSTALKYLNGTGGHPRDGGEAVRWLWRAVAKQNTEATELLADLYLKGEVVPRNCEQARILLDAAARKGTKQAAERLRHLQDFGCQ